MIQLPSTPYAKHGRTNGGNHEAMPDAADPAWAADRGAGRTSLLVAADNATVTDLNQRIRAALVGDGQLTPDGADCVTGRPPAWATSSSHVRRLCQYTLLASDG
jgi:hypothetical protein